MIPTVWLFTVIWAACIARDVYYPSLNITRQTPSGIAEYRSALTLDWLAAEDFRQRELARAFETEAGPLRKILASDCIGYEKPASGKVARLMLELLKNLEGDEAKLIPALIQALIRSKLLVETSMLEAEPDLEALMETPEVMMGEPHTTFPKILAMVWIAATDPITAKKHGWCPVHKVTNYLIRTRPAHIAKHIRTLDPVVARARFIAEEFMQHVTPNMYDRKNYIDHKEISVPSSQDFDNHHQLVYKPYHMATRTSANKIRAPPVLMMQSSIKPSVDCTPGSRVEKRADSVLQGIGYVNGADILEALGHCAFLMVPFLLILWL